MSEEFGANFVSITDEDGNEYELEHLDTIEYNGQMYMAFFPVVDADEDSSDDEEEDYGLIILKVIQENGEDLLATVDDEVEMDAVYEEFMNALFDEDEE